MDVIDSIEDLPAGLRFAFTLGVFDGVHVGHRLVLERTVSVARGLDATSVALTFHPHPEAVLRGRQPPSLCDPEERVALIEETGIDVTVRQRFDREFSQQSPDEFIRRMAAGRELVAVLMTPESAFGHDRAGTIAEIERLGTLNGFQVVHVEPLSVAGASVSSSRIRELLASGRLAEARTLLGRTYAVTGTAAGDEVGDIDTTIQFGEPTALPGPGRYRILASWGQSDALAPASSATGAATVGPPADAAPETDAALTLHLPGDRPAIGERVRIEFFS